MSARAACTLFVILAALPSTAGAHQPAVLQSGVPYTIADYAVSYALYGVFDQGDEQFTVSMDFPEDFALPFELFVPHRSELADHRPAFAVVGPGLPVPDAAEMAALPRSLPAGSGAFVELNRVSPRPAFYEFFTRRFFWSSGPVALVLPAGHYEIWIWSPQRTRGKFGIGFGVEEKFDFVRAFDGYGTYAF